MSSPAVTARHLVRGTRRHHIFFISRDTERISARTLDAMPISFMDIFVGDAYTREELANLWGYAGIEAISRGVVTPKDDNKIVLFVTRNKRPEDTQYRDDLVGSILLWEGPRDHFAEARILDHVSRGDEIHLFYREEHRGAFVYRGLFQLYCGQMFSDRPSRFVFQSQAGAAQRAA